MPSRPACSSTKLPVPAAHTLFIWKSDTWPCAKLMYLESCPPISNTVSTCGSAWAAPRACAVISSRTASAPMKLPIMVRPLPVQPAATTCALSPTRSASEESPSRTACLGLPRVRRYCASSSTPSKLMSTRFVLVDPTSTPSATGTGAPSGKASTAAERGTAAPSRAGLPAGFQGVGASANPRFGVQSVGGSCGKRTRSSAAAAVLPASAAARSVSVGTTGAAADAAPAGAAGAGAEPAAPTPLRATPSPPAPASAAASAAPNACAHTNRSSATSSPSSSPNTSRTARTTPALSSVPPASASGFSTGRLRTMVALNAFTVAWHKPCRMSSTHTPSCWRWMMSVFANTEQRPDRRGTLVARDTSSE